MELVGVAEVARLLGVTDSRVRQLRLRGRLPPEAGVISGRRVYRRADIERFKRQRSRYLKALAALQAPPRRS